MHRLPLIALVLLTLASCSLPNTSHTEQRVRALLPGTWTGESRMGGNDIHFTKTYFPDGTARGEIRSSYRVRGAVVHAAPVTFVSRWQVRGNILQSYDAHSTPVGYLNSSTVFTDRVRQIDAQRFTFDDLTNGGTQHHRRVSPLQIAR
jgi:hypothetical protein